jgi:hypothetical protein
MLRNVSTSRSVLRKCSTVQVVATPGIVLLTCRNSPPGACTSASRNFSPFSSQRLHATDTPSEDVMNIRSFSAFGLHGWNTSECSRQ